MKIYISESLLYIDLTMLPMITFCVYFLLTLCLDGLVCRVPL